MTARLFLSSGDLMADRRFEFARDLQLKGDLPAAADLLLQAIELAPNFVRLVHARQHPGQLGEPMRRSLRSATPTQPTLMTVTAQVCG
jgi:hypothetical protein